MSAQEDIRYIPYRQEGEPERKAALTRVDVSLDGLSDEELQILGHLVEAADAINPIFRDQYEPRTDVLRSLVTRLAEAGDDHEAALLSHYRTMLDLQNSPYALLPRKSMLLDIDIERLRKLAELAYGEMPEGVDELLTWMTTGHTTPDKANFYPEDITEDELKELGDDAKVVNSSIVRDADGDLFVVLNEDRYSETLWQAVEHLRAARDLVEAPSFRLYLDAKILELQTGSEEARRIADYTWVRHSSRLDIVVSTALEVYLDNLKNAHGASSGGVYVTNESAEELLKALIERVPHWEAEAPWTYRKSEIDPERLPKLKFVDVWTWAGDYVTGPFTTIAQSLPNDEWVGQNVGTVNMVYMNTGRAVHKVAGNLAAEEFLTADEYNKVKDLLFDANQLHSALHEIGHTTGRQASEASKGQPSDYLEEEYSFLEETRAELFGLFALDVLVKDGVIAEEMAHACYDGMVITMVMSLKFDPVQAHNKARNGMFHEFEKQGAIRRVEENGKTRFAVDHDKAHGVVCDMLKRVADLKAVGAKKETVELREALVFTDDLKAEIEERTSHFPLGRGLIFPRLKKDGNRYLRELVYPDDFSEQVKFNLELLD